MAKDGGGTKAGGDRAAYWRGLVARWERSGQTPEAFCRQRHVKAGTFGWWRSRLKRRAADGTAGPPSREPGFLEVHVAGASEEAVSPWVYEVALVNGRRVRVGRAFDAESLGRLVAVLEGSC